MAKVKKSQKARIRENQAVTRWLKAVLEDESFVDVGVLANPDTGKWTADQPKTKKIRRETENLTVGDPDVNIIDVAVIHEFGTSVIPQRSFIRSTYEENKANITEIFTRLIKKEVRQGKNKRPNTRIILEKVGAFYTGKVQRRFTTAKDWPPLAPATIQAKKSSRPLIDTGQLRQSIAWRVTRIFEPLKEVKQI